MRALVSFVVGAVLALLLIMSILRLGYQWGKREGDKAVQFEKDYCRAQLEKCEREP